MATKVNIADVAKQAGVAVSTVSRVINGGPVSPQVREKVREVMKQLGFTPSRRARNLRLGIAGAVGLLVPTISDPWLQRIIEGMEEECASRQITLLLGHLGEAPDYDPRVAEWWIRDQMVDGLVFTGPGKREIDLVEKARDENLGLVFIGSNTRFECGQIIHSDNVEGGRVVARHLLQMGHQRIGYLGGAADNMDSQHRLLGMREVLAPKRLAIPNDMVAEGNWQAPDGIAYALRWIDQDKASRPTAIVCANDAMAIGVMSELLRQGVDVPREVSIVGFDDLAMSRYAHPGLTSVRQHLNIMGGAAVRAVYDQREQRDNSEKDPVRFTMELMVRGSTGKAPS